MVNFKSPVSLFVKTVDVILSLGVILYSILLESPNTPAEKSTSLFDKSMVFVKVSFPEVDVGLIKIESFKTIPCFLK